MTGHSIEPTGVASSDRTDADLVRIAEIAAELGAESIRTDATEERRRLAEARFFVACIGQFKRGKSTLLNALVGMPVVPTGVVPVTSVVTILRHGDHPHALVRFVSGRVEPLRVEDIATIVDECRNPHNEKQAVVVETFLPSTILLNGLCLVDTPGLGSVFAENTTATRNFVTHIDVALVVLGADPPITGTELDLVAEVGSEADHLLVVMNKADQASPEQRDEVTRFTVDVVERRIGRPVGRVFEVSALERIERGEATRDWAAFECALRQLAETKRSLLVTAASRRIVARLARQLRSEIAQQEEALRRPLDETRDRVATLRADLSDLDRSLRDLRFLFQAAEEELRPYFERQRNAFVEQVTAGIRQALERWRAEHSVRLPRRSLRLAASAEAQRYAERAIDDWSARLEPEVAALYQRTTARFVELASSYTARLIAHAGLTADDVDVPDATTLVKREFVFTSLMHLTAGSPRTWFFDYLAPRVWRDRDVTRSATAYASHLIESNSHRIENDFRERTAESRRRLEQAIRKRLTDTLASSERALASATGQVRLGDEFIRGRLQRLATLGHELRVSSE